MDKRYSFFFKTSNAMYVPTKYLDHIFLENLLKAEYWWCVLPRVVGDWGIGGFPLQMNKRWPERPAHEIRRSVKTRQMECEIGRRHKFVNFHLNNVSIVRIVCIGIISNVPAGE